MPLFNPTATVLALSNNQVDSGQEVFSRELLTSVTVAAATSQQLRLNYFVARKSETTTQVKVYSGGTAAAATPSLVRFGLYSVAANGDLTLVASIANDTTIFAGASTAYTRSWSVAYAMVAGQRYALGVLVVSAAAMPTYTGTTVTSPTEQAISPMFCGVIGGQADLPLGPVAAAGISATTGRIYGVILP